MGSDGPNDGQVFVLGVPEVVVALELLSHVADGIEAAALVKLVDGHDVGKVEHVDFFQLGSGAEFRCHDVQGHVAVVHDFRVALTDATRLEDDEVES